MYEFEKLREKRAKYLETAQSIVTKALGESRALTADETKDVGGLREKAQGIADTIKTVEEMRGLTSGAGNGTQGGARFTGPQGGGEQRGPFQSFGEQLRAVVQAGSPGGQADSRLYEVRAASGMNEAVPSEGGFLLQNSFSYELLQAGLKRAKLAPRCRPFPIGPNANGINLPMVDEASRATGSRYGGVRLYWAGEAGTITPSKPKIRMVSLNLKKLVAAVWLTDELAQDVTMLEAFVRGAYAEEYAFTIDDQIIRGAGAGQMLGFLNSGALITVPKETGQVAKTLVVENIVNMWSRMPASSLDTCVWLCNQDTFPQLFTMGVSVGTGGVPIFMPAGGISQSPYSTIMGKPVIPMEQCATLGSVSDLCLVDLSHYLLADKGLQTATSIHVNFLQAENVLRVIQRIDGQPDVNSPLQPYQGTATQSPFIVLAERA